MRIPSDVSPDGSAVAFFNLGERQGLWGVAVARLGACDEERCPTTGLRGHGGGEEGGKEKRKIDRERAHAESTAPRGTDQQQKVSKLSGGERNRLHMAKLLKEGGNLILLDEPFAGIDPIAVADIQQIITRLKDRGIGILITDHNVQETLSITDRAYIINEGLILEAGSPAAIVKSETARAVYLGEGFKL